MIRMINPSGGITLVADDRISEYTAEGFKPFALAEIPKISAKEEKEALEAIEKADIKPIKAKTKKGYERGNNHEKG